MILEKRTTGRSRKRGAPAKKRAVTAACLVLVLGLSAGALGCAADQTDNPSRDGSEINAEIDAAQWAPYVPKVVVTDDGTRVQITPFGPSPDIYGLNAYDPDWMYYNTYILNGDQRGCNSCHDLENVLREIKHPSLYQGAYPSQKYGFATYSTCGTCHGAKGLMGFSHAHMNRQSFKDENGSCLSCHYIDEDGTYKPWDEVRYDVETGIVPVSAEELDADVSYTQDEITPDKWMFTDGKASNGYAWDYVPHSDNILNEHTITFSGGIAQETTMTIQELIDKFGSETKVEAVECVLNGTGENLIYQAEVTGVPLSKVIDYVAPASSSNSAAMGGVDGYWAMTKIDALKDALIVYEMNGEPLPDSQGYPVALWLGGGRAAGSNTRYLSEIIFDSEETLLASELPFSTVSEDGERGTAYMHSETGDSINTPDIGVLSTPSGTIFEAGKPVHLEGYAHAFVEPVTKIEFSLDSGETWKEVPIPDMDPSRWVYWKMDLDLEPGAYTLQMRATSIDETTGQPHTNAFMPKFLINVEQPQN